MTLKQFCAVQAQSLPVASFILTIFQALVAPRGRRGSSPGQKWPFYLVLPHSWDLPFCIKLLELYMPYFCWLAETGGTWSNHLVYTFLCSKKVWKVILFKIPSFKIKNKPSANYPHRTRAPFTTPIPASLNNHICSFLTSVYISPILE